MSRRIAAHIAEVRKRIPKFATKPVHIILELNPNYCAPDVYRMLETKGGPAFVPFADLMRLTPAPDRIQADGLLFPGTDCTRAKKINT